MWSYLEAGSSGRTPNQMKSGEWVPSDGITALTKSSTRISLSPHLHAQAKGRPGEDVRETKPIWEPRRGLSPDTKSVCTLILGSWPSRTAGNKCLLFKPPTFWYVGKAAQADYSGTWGLEFNNNSCLLDTTEALFNMEWGALWNLAKRQLAADVA